MPAPYTVKPAATDPRTCDIYEDGERRLLLTVWNKPGTEGTYAKRVATRIARLLNESEYPLGEHDACTCGYHPGDDTGHEAGCTLTA